MKNYLKMTREGFTLVELMVVVAIIGILASIAIPQYSKFQAKARQSEVKIQLGAAYTVEQSFAAENSSYTGCLGQIGYNRDGSKFYYTVGFYKTPAAGCGPDGSLDCTYYQFSQAGGVWSGVATAKCTDATVTQTFFENNSWEKGGALQDNTKLPSTAVISSQAAFLVGATGFILSGATNASGAGVGVAAGYDAWTIDQGKQIINVQGGLN